MLTIQIEAEDCEIEAFAQFLKRAGYSDYRKKAKSDKETYQMLFAGLKIGDALASAGFRVR